MYKIDFQLCTAPIILMHFSTQNSNFLKYLFLIMTAIIYNLGIFHIF